MVDLEHGMFKDIILLLKFKCCPIDESYIFIGYFLCPI